MALDALKVADITQVYWMYKRLVGLMAGLAFAIREGAEIDRMLKRLCLRRPTGVGGVSQNCVTEITVVAYHLSGVTNVLAVVATETTGEIEVADIVRVRLPVSLHRRERVGLKDSLNLTD